MDQQIAELLVRIGAGTPMGNLMRRYWVPIMLSSEIAEPDCAPVRVKILGEKLLAFRDSEGRPGLVDEFCAHRGASLFLGRNEEGGIDTTHASWVHRFELEQDPMHKHAEANKYIKADRNAVFDLEESPHGLTIFGRRNVEADSHYWRV